MRLVDRLRDHHSAGKLLARPDTMKSLPFVGAAGFELSLQ
jgi:hypothetical protein